MKEITSGYESVSTNLERAVTLRNNCKLVTNHYPLPTTH
jgi:hypothetical protein